MSLPPCTACGQGPMFRWASVAPGLQLPAPATVAKAEASTAHSAETATLIVGHKAFSAAAAPAADRGACVLTATVAEGRAADEGVLLGVGAEGTPLDTPLSWEEDHAVLLECSARGAFLWCERAALYGAKVSDRCLVPTEAGLRATVHVAWGPDRVEFAVVDGAGAALGDAAVPRPVVAEVQGRDATVEGGHPPLAPFATMLGTGVTVTVASA